MRFGYQPGLIAFCQLLRQDPFHFALDHINTSGHSNDSFSKTLSFNVELLFRWLVFSSIFFLHLSFPSVCCIDATTLHQPTPILMLFGSNKAKTVAKDVEGKIQESIGLVTGDEGDRLAGKAKQAEANARDTADTLTSKAGMG